MNTIDKIKRNGIIPYINSCNSEYTKKCIDLCYELGLDVVKINEEHLKDVFPLYPLVSFVEDISDAKMIEISCGRDLDEVKELLEDEIARLLNLRIEHVGINSENEEAALNTCKALEKFFFKKYKDVGGSFFQGNREFEIMKTKGRGTYGHIALLADDIDRCIYYLSKRGVDFDETSIAAKDGIKTLVYLKDEIAGFAFHLVRLL